MTLTLSPLLDAMVTALNAHDGDAFLACLADDAVVRDEGRMHVGAAAIRAWFEEVTRKYRPHLEVTRMAIIDGEPVLVGQVSGNFAGSPAELQYHVAVEEGRIVALKITG